jgi:hypothetical protein
MGGRTNSDGQWVEFGSDGSVESVGGESVSSHDSGTACWGDDSGTKFDDSGPSNEGSDDDTRGDPG